MTFRLIARLDIRNEHLIKTIRCEGVRKVGDPADYAKRYDEAGIDEILYLDTVASLYGRNSLEDLIRRSAERCFCPLTGAGGICSLNEARDLLYSGIDKLGVNSSAIHCEKFITRLAEKFGSQAVVLQLDAKRKDGGWEAYTHGGRQPTGRDALSWAVEAVERGAGEILATSIDREGTRAGFDLELGRALASLPVPVILSGGFGAVSDAVAAWETDVSGIAISGALHYGRVTLDQIREELANAGAPVRFPELARQAGLRETRHGKVRPGVNY